MKKFLFVFMALVIGTSVIAKEAEIFNLDNGQTVIIKEVRTNPIVTVDTWIKTGSINENDKNNGVSHFLEHLFFKGSTNHAQMCIRDRLRMMRIFSVRRSSWLMKSMKSLTLLQIQ